MGKWDGRWKRNPRGLDIYASVINSSDRRYRRAKEKGGLYAINIPAISCGYWFRSAKKGGKRNALEKRGGKETLNEGVTTSLRCFISQSTPVINSSWERIGKESSESIWVTYLNLGRLLWLILLICAIEERKKRDGGKEILIIGGSTYITQIPRSQSTPILPIDAIEGERRMRWERNSERGRHICSKATQMHFNQLSGGKETLWGVPTSLRYP